MGYRVAVVGATGNVGREMLNILAERKFPASEVIALASSRSQGQEISFGDKRLKVQNLENFDFTGVDFALMSAGSAIAKEYGEKIGRTGCIVVDNSSFWRYHGDVPLVVPEVNAHVLDEYMARNDRKNIIANPNCSTAQLVVATYQSVSGAGKEGVDELWDQTKSVFVNNKLEPRKFTKQIAFNVIPHIDVFMEDGYTKEEWKMIVETHKILDPTVDVVPTCVRVPVFVGHSESINIEFHSPMDEQLAREILREAPGVAVVDKREAGGYITPIEVVGEFDTYVSRIRNDPTVPYGISLWCASDNLRKGAALNAVQIAQLLDERGVIATVAA